MMKDAGINVVRVYDPITDKSVLDALWRRGIYVVMNVYAWGGHPVSRATNAVKALRNHPAILMWEVGNEWNFNGLYHGMSLADARSRVAEVVRAVKQHDRNHPVATVYGQLPDADTLNALQDVDIWGFNVYRGLHFGNLFADWEARSPKPMYLAEYGADAWDARSNQQNLAAQRDATIQLTQEIIHHSTRNSHSRLCSGGFIYEFSDEWWKDQSGDSSRQDTGGVAPGGGPYPDNTFNEEWWGLVTITRQKRSAFDAYKSLKIPR